MWIFKACLLWCCFRRPSISLLQMQKSISLNFVLQLSCKRITIQLLEYSPSSGAVSDLQEQIGKTKCKKSISRKQKELREIRWWQNNRNFWFKTTINICKNAKKTQYLGILKPKMTIVSRNFRFSMFDPKIFFLDFGYLHGARRTKGLQLDFS